MNKRLAGLTTAFVMTALCMPLMPVSGAENTDSVPRIMENLDRGLVAAKTNNGVYLSWRLLGTESLTEQAFDIYKNGRKIHTTLAHDATCYEDTDGTVNDKYKVVPANTTATDEEETFVWQNMIKHSVSSGSLPYLNRLAYKDLLFDAPEGGTTPDGAEYTYTANDMSVGDLDGDGQYELIVKWDPSNSQDNSNSGYTGNVIIDAYEMNEVYANRKAERLWRIDLGRNIRAGAHYTQYLVYDFDCDGKSEIVFKTAPNSKDANGDYVSKVGKGITVVNDETADYRNSSGQIITGEEYLTIFNGETGAAMQTVPYEPPRDIVPITKAGWGDTSGNRCERYLAGVAYLDGVRPSAIFTRGYYTYAYAAAYSWDGKNLNLQWLSKNNPSSCTVEYANGTTKTQTGKTLYGQGAHSVSVADVDNDGCDELIFGSAVLDNDGTVLIYDNRGHGDAEHVSDFDNDGKQEIFFVHEAGKGKEDVIDFAVDIKRYDASTTSGAYDVMKQPAVGDIGRGAMANIDDEFAYEEWQKGNSKNLAAFWSTANASSVFNENGDAIGNIPNSNNNLFENMFIYWDGDLGRELIDGTMLAKHSIKNNTTARLEFASANASMFPDVSSNNGTKANPGLVADIFGDWREEVIYRLWDGSGVRIYMSTIPTEYRLTTLMHDSQYRCAVAWQNVGYNQPAHQSYYIGSAALATDDSGNPLNYLVPEVSFTEMTYPGYEEGPAPVPPSKTTSNVIYEKGTNTDTAWSSSDLEDWVQSGTASAFYDAERATYGGIYNIQANTNTNKVGAYAVSKSFNFTPKAVVTYEVEWYLNNTIKKNNVVYLQFGSAVKIGSCKDGGSNYFTWVKTGDDWDDLDGDGTWDNVYATKCDNKPVKVSLTVDTSTNRIVSLDIAGNTLAAYENKELDGTIDSIIFGADKGSVTWSLAAGLNSLKVTEATEGAVISSITATAAKTTYKNGEAFDKSTVSVTAHYSDGTDEELTPYYFSVTGYDKDAPGEQTLTVHVGDLTDTITVTVREKQVTSLALSGDVKTQYFVGDDIDLTKLTVTAIYEDGTEKVITDYTVSGYDKTQTGEQTITVSFGGKSESFKVTVSEIPRTDTYIKKTADTLSLSGGVLSGSVNASLENYSGSATLVLAVYDENGILRYIDYTDSKQAAFGNISVSGIADYKYKIFSWDSLGGMKVLCDYE